MKAKNTNYLKAFVLIFCFFAQNNIFAQKGYSRDSLQIKVYTQIHYDQFKPIKIEVTKVFCDYCSENQMKHLKEIGWEMAYNERNAPENVMSEGKKRLAIYLRVPKDKFRLLKDE